PKSAGPMGRAVVGQDAAHADTVGTKPAQRASQKAAGGRLPFVGGEPDVGDARVIIDGDVQVFPAGTAELMKALASNAVSQAANPAELLGIQMEQIAD